MKMNTSIPYGYFQLRLSKADGEEMMSLVTYYSGPITDSEALQVISMAVDACKNFPSYGGEHDYENDTRLLRIVLSQERFVKYSNLIVEQIREENYITIENDLKKILGL